MNKFFTSLLLIFIITSFTSSAAIYKGQREFVKKCVKCHKSGQAFVATKKKVIWKKLMKNKGEKLSYIHLYSSDDKALSSKEYFKSKHYTDKSKHLKQFLMEYAKDSGNVPACN